MPRVMRNCNNGKIRQRKYHAKSAINERVRMNSRLRDCTKKAILKNETDANSFSLTQLCDVDLGVEI